MTNHMKENLPRVDFKMKIRNPVSILKNRYQKLIKFANPKFSLKKSKSTLRIDQEPNADYELVKIHGVGLADPFAVQGVVVLKTDDGKEFPISAFSGEVAQYISNFIDEKRDSLPTIYNMLEQICEENELLLVIVKVILCNYLTNNLCSYVWKLKCVCSNMHAFYRFIDFFHFPVY